jgi:NAD(P)-dependent dehydrogenase (short-subunit alcohol dehydrogenase family)
MAKYYVTVNAILPGMIHTDMTRDFTPPTVKDLDEFMGQMAKGVPPGREGTVEDIASAPPPFFNVAGNWQAAGLLFPL